MQPNKTLIPIAPKRRSGLALDCGTSMIGEIVAEGIFQVACYGLGKTMAVFFLPHLGIEPLEKQKSMPPWKWRGFTYEKSGRRFLYTESLQLIGLCVMLVIGIGIGVVVSNAI